LACASPFPPEAVALENLSSGLDWDLLLELGAEHSVLGLVATRLSDSGFAGVPDSARVKLQARMRAQHLFTLSMTAELFHVLEDFAQAGIGTLLVKGPLISLLAFGDPAVRSYVDLDLIVRDRDVLTASRRMEAVGYPADVPEAAILAGKIPGEYMFNRPGTQQLIELHTEKTFRYYPQPMRIEDLFARQRRVVVDGREIPVLSMEDEFVLNCVHGAKHFWERLMWPTDIAAIVVRHAEMDWERVRQYAGEVGALRMVHVALLLAKSLWGVEVPPPMAKQVEEDHPAGDLVRQIEGWLPYSGFAPPPLHRRAAFRYQMGGGGVVGASHLMRLSFSPTEEDWSNEEEKGSKILEAVKRPFRLLRKYGQDG